MVCGDEYINSGKLPGTDQIRTRRGPCGWGLVIVPGDTPEAVTHGTGVWHNERRHSPTKRHINKL